MGTAVVFAGNSFLGKTLCPVLRERGVRVVATARGHCSSVDYSPCDLTRHSEVESLLERARPDWVIQCAGATRTAESGNVRSPCRRHAGVLSARRACASGNDSPRQRAEYGRCGGCLPINETCPERHDPVRRLKLAQTQRRAAASQWHCVLTVRPFNDRPSFPITHFAAARMSVVADAFAPRPGPFPVMNLDATRDFVDVRDVADALVGLLGEAPPAAGEMDVYNIATGVETSLADVATKFGSLAGGYKPTAGAGGDSRGGVVRSRGDATRLHRKTGWTPRRTWEESLSDLWESLQKV